MVLPFHLSTNVLSEESRLQACDSLTTVSTREDDTHASASPSERGEPPGELTPSFVPLSPLSFPQASHVLPNPGISLLGKHPNLSKQVAAKWGLALSSTMECVLILPLNHETARTFPQTPTGGK